MAISQTSVDIRFTYRNFTSLKSWLTGIIGKHKLKVGEIAIVYVSDEFLLSLNRDFLNHDFYTDVLAFDYSVNNKVNCDILVSIERVKDNAAKYQIEFYRELDRVILHGLLHILGYDDSSAASLQNMRMIEDTYLKYR